MKKSLLLTVTVLSGAMLFAGCGTNTMSSTDVSDLAQESLAKGGVPPPAAPIVTTVPLVSLTRQVVGAVDVWNDNSKLYVKVRVDSGMSLSASALAVETSLEEIPRNKRGWIMPNWFENKRDYEDGVREDTYEFDLVWEGGTEIFISLFSRLEAPVYNPRLKRYIGHRTMFAWSAGSGFPGKKYDKYFTDVIDKSLIIIIK
jgi:predicted small secreted protein